MNLMPSGLGAEPKKVIAVIVLMATAGGLYVYNSQPDVPAGAIRPTTTTGSVPLAPVTQPRPPARRPTPIRVNEDFRPSLNLPEDFDISSIDPTLKLDLLARVRSVPDVGGRRSLFEFYVPPPPPVKVEPIKPVTQAPPPPPPQNPVVVTPPPTPIPFKFYGFTGSAREGNLQALLSEGEETYVVKAGDTVKNRWRIARIGVATIDVEDLTAKSTRPLQISPKCDDKDDTRCWRPQ